MSDIIYNATNNIDGTPYQKGGWRQYAVHNDKEIKGFFGAYSFLSNFHPCEVYFEGYKYPSSENAYQAAKGLPHTRAAFTLMTAIQSKTAWKNLDPEDLIQNWDMIKYDVMCKVVFNKFAHNKDLRKELLRTGNKYLEESNHWQDSYWGYDVIKGKGSNKMGEILMRTRTFWQ
jgi:ribA/ribD-fused uncharacterized protein